MASTQPSALILASASPRRQALLRQLGIPLVVDPAHVDEAGLPGEDARSYVQRISRKKVHAVAPLHPGSIVLGADTAVVIGARVLGKPRDAEEALRMLELLSGQLHQVVTGVFASGPRGERDLVVSTTVRFKPISAPEARWYVATGEPMDKAGAYAIQERGAMFVEAIDGSHSNVIGLPLAETLALLSEVGFPLPWEEAS